MRLFAFFIMFLAALGTNADAATAGQRRGGASATASASGGTSAARSATSARAAVRNNAPATASAPAAAARAATTGRAVATRGAAPAAQPAAVGARAATTQKVINSGTKVAAATQNTVVSEECRQKYEGCMDSFCMLDNTSGGRCICSDKNAELNDILAEIEKLDQQSYQMATFGVEKIEMGSDADQAIANANAAAQSVIKQEEQAKKKSARKALDLSAWNTLVDFDTDDAFGETNSMQSMIDGKEGDALHRAAAQLCTQQMPECGSDLSMLQMMYSQKIRSDCSAYENSLKQQKNASAQKLYAAEQALREAALEQLHIANKYDLGQCTTEFKKCMITTGGCGEDFANCASVSAMDNTNTTKSTKNTTKMYAIKGSATTIEIFASTYDTLEGKKPLCMGITESCVAVKDKVWDTFLREVAPQIKSAELIAEDKARQECVGNISACFQKACKDTMDPNDPDGSYDMCLSRPLTMLNVCKIPLNACGISTNSKKDAENSQIWQFVVARLASMRVDSCTKEVKACLTSDDRCGEDFSQCVGLDTDSIIRMCPYEKLTGCVELYGDRQVKSNEVYDKLADMVQGIMLNIDNNFLTQCQNAANEAMIKVCGDTESCNGLAVDENIGARSLEYKICEYKSDNNTMDISYSGCRTDVAQIQDSELGRVEGATSAGLGPITPFAGVLDGTIYWESVDFDDDGRLVSVDEYLDRANQKDATEAQKERVRAELALLQKNIDTAINVIESDTTVQFCMTGREVQGMKRSGNETRSRIGEKSADAARFPGLTKQMRMLIATQALKVAKENYYKKFDELNEKMMKDYATIGERIAEIQGENALDARREFARVACVSFAEISSLPKSPNPPKGFGSQFFGAVGGALSTVVGGVAAAVGVVAVPFTGGLSLGLTAGGAALVGAGIAGMVSSSKAGNSNGADASEQRELVGSKQLNQWNYKEVITSTFEWETLNCHKCVRSQQCTKKGNPLFGSKYCKSWADPVETCTDTQF